ncbi:hypothetical protein QAD02_010901 [Eretmocerus hayati]|uniref:Uncharacterized protein n=1 Tax=Eretmocerus hayati TaxID=131215 RepID=A0ACC2NV60_9HYME|nr:hypothetical protein QAD02_010901 [Eretmocerus hayati]
MLRSQLREQVWIKQEAEENDDSDDFELFLPPTPPLLEKPSLVPYKPHQKKRRLKRRKLHTPYCRICKKYFHSYNQLSYHRRLTHKKQQESEETKNNNHPDTDPLELEPPKADLSQVDDDDSKDERFEYRPLLPCRDCLRYFTCPRELLQHRQYLDCLKREPDEESSLSEVTDDEYEYDILYSCTTCRAKFISTRLLELHRRREGHHHTTTKTAQKKVLDDEVDGIIGSKEDESEFVYKSVEEGEFLCAVCDNGVVYLDPDDLLKHHRAVHSAKNLMHYCRYCAHEVKGPAEFADHHLAYHQMRQFCRLCPDAKDKLVQYRKGLPPKPVCLECARKSDMPFDHCLKLLQENLYCDNCDGSLPSIAHVRFHNCTTEPPGPHKMLSLLACPLCLEGFNGLRSHLEDGKHHHHEHQELTINSEISCEEIKIENVYTCRDWIKPEPFTNEHHFAQQQLQPKFLTVYVRPQTEVQVNAVNSFRKKNPFHGIKRKKSAIKRKDPLFIRCSDDKENQPSNKLFKKSSTIETTSSCTSCKKVTREFEPPLPLLFFYRRGGSRRKNLRTTLGSDRLRLGRRSGYTFWYPCAECPMKFTRGRLLVNHVVKEHPHFCCKHCLKSMEKRSSLKSHLAEHYKKCKPPFKCDECELTYKHLFSLVNHKETHVSYKLPAKLVASYNVKLEHDENDDPFDDAVSTTSALERDEMQEVDRLDVKLEPKIEDDLDYSLLPVKLESECGDSFEQYFYAFLE